MKTFECQVCGHLAFGEAPANCPICGAAREKYNEVKDAVKNPVDPANLTESENKHIPQVNISGSKVEVKVGGIPHPMLPEHHIMFIDYYVNGRGIKRSRLGSSQWQWQANTPLKAAAQATEELNLKPGDELKVLEYCNLHGRWVKTVKI